MPSAPTSNPNAPERWFPSRKPLPDARLRLFALPFAGGSASIYSGWQGGLPPGVELCAVQLPGRERRLMEKPFDSLPALVDTLLPVLAPLLDKPFAFFGYSMGSRISLELTRRLQARNGPMPRGLVLAASGAPRESDRKPIHHLPQEQFIEELRRYDGTPEEILQHRELLELLVPTLRADFALAWWENGVSPVKLDVPISVMGGTTDKHVSLARLETWREETRSPDFRIRHFDGGHFFLRAQQAALLAALGEDLTRWMSTPA
ncbi:alpha/beta fold hydrolase [Myxococcus sp. MISCRS1]|jgi:surfactin synthase thioesterase subunit|uniref:thioesterase II family protein n=1 Tax=Myxococcus TaxID=32 RepID=UPI001CC05C3E|nr:MULTISPECIES: thioesterase domain-containing protein [unclassified Myxococcus]MBZ4398101.1 alpha/beta fold hydrolase [Myxococcus sp. AS-1-15]MBZ4409216.1 alpha/beta fold hydrolase [Myxococcus sp. XM-1-1-1]MCY1003378.1 alpha/beta fold hydrolase [Myxococcus sp. MISCRS1]